MSRVQACPSDQELRSLMIGLVPESVADDLENHLLFCPSCLNRFKNLPVEDPLVGVIRDCPSAINALVDQSRVDDLVHRLESLQPPSHGQEQALSQPAASRELAEAHTLEASNLLAPPQQPDEIGRLGAYRVLRVLGTGGMGVVFEAEELQLERRVALKVMKPALASNSIARRRFLREAKAAAAIAHDHIVPIFQVGEDQNVPFLAMPLLRGESLEGRLKRETRLDVSEVCRVGREIAEGLALAHESGLIHRDIKPANIWLETSQLSSPENQGAGRVKILDFGLAQVGGDEPPLTQSGVILGTPGYMAPEQTDGRKIDARSDLFSLGCLLYRTATGLLPFQGTDVVSALYAAATMDPQPPCALNSTLASGVSDLIMRLLNKDPGDRPNSAREVVERIRELESISVPVARSGPIATVTPEAKAPSPAPQARKRKPAFVVGVAVMTLVAATLVVFQIIITIKAKGGQETKLKVPEGSTVTIEVKNLPTTEAKIPDSPVPERSPLDSLSRDRIDPYELKVAGDGDPARAPSELVAILGDSRLKHWSMAKAFAFDPKGRWLASGDNSRITIWDSTTGREVRTLSQSGPAWALCFSPDGNQLAAANDKLITVFNTKDWRQDFVWDRAHGMPACTAGRATSQTTGASASASHRGIPAGRGSGDFAFPIAVASLANIIIELTGPSAYHSPVSVFPGQHIFGPVALLRRAQRCLAPMSTGRPRFIAFQLLVQPRIVHACSDRRR
jgi:serine/threonine protein kinase